MFIYKITVFSAFVYIKLYTQIFFGRFALLTRRASDWAEHWAPGSKIEQFLNISTEII